MNLIEEAKKRGYREGLAIRYVPHAIDYVEGNFFEIDEKGDVVAYKKEEDDRESFEDFKWDTLYSKSEDKWVEIVS